jgi:hypothetical protein
MLVHCATTLVFCRQYDFTKVVTCAAIVYGFMAGVPLISWGVFTQTDVQLSLIQLLCIYGCVHSTTLHRS